MTGRVLHAGIPLLLAAVAAAPGGAAEAPLVVAQFPTSTPAPSAFSWGTFRAGFGEGGRIVVVSPDGQARVLTGEFDSAAEPDVSFDGTKVLFAGRKAADDPWCIWEMPADGTAAREITCGPGEARQPIYIPTLYTLNPTMTDAWEQIAFVGTLPGETNEAGAGPHTALFTATFDGERVRRISFNLSSDFDPTLLPDGRLLFASWQRHSMRHGPLGRVSLFASHIDGVDLMLFAGDEGQRVKHMPAYAGDRLVVFVEGDRVAGDGGGSLASVSLRRNLHSYRSLSTDGLYHSPSTHPDGGVLVSWRSQEGQYGVFRLSADDGKRIPAFDDPEWHDVQARVLAPRPVPDRRSSSVRDGDPAGGIFGLDVSISDLGREVFPLGTARRLRVLEGVAARTDASGVTRPATNRLLGEADLARDGSFHVAVPANTPLQLQLLDEDGLALRSCGWIWVRDHEQRGCIGCHEDTERTPPNRFVQALGQEPPALTPPPEQRRTLTFERDVQPIVTRVCVQCHGEGMSPRLDVDPARVLEKYVFPGRARISPLTWHLMGRATHRPWDGVDDPMMIPRPPGGVPLTKEELRSVLEWMDSGATWSEGEQR